LEGREEEVLALDTALSAAARAVRDAKRQEPVDPARLASAREHTRVARKTRRAKLRKWEADWWRDIAEQANRAQRQGDMAELYKCFKSLRDRSLQKVQDGRAVSAANLEEERDAWASHFEKVSATPGEVPEEVWERLPPPVRNARGLG
jgi:hypothetical protein